MSQEKHFLHPLANSWPPLARIYPQVALCFVDSQWPIDFVRCPCGVIGKPEALAWMGDCCGPCYDRRELG